MSTKNNLPEDGFGREFIITREFDAPRELVFDAHSGKSADEPGQLVTTVTFDDQDGKMKLTLRALLRSATKPSKKNTTPSRAETKPSIASENICRGWFQPRSLAKMAFEASFCDRHSLPMDTCAIHGVTLWERGPATRNHAAIAGREKFSLECPEPACSFVVFLTEEKQHIKRKAKI